MDGRIAVIAVTGEMLARTGAQESELVGLSSIPREIEGVKVGITLREKEGGFKVSLRTVEKIDASQICAVFGGGGHARAAGWLYPGTAGAVPGQNHSSGAGPPVRRRGFE